jgi:DNA topoisomerase-3
MKRMIEALVNEVRSENKRANISHVGKVQKQKPQVEKKKASGIAGTICPKCKKATLIKGKSAYGCTAYKEGCDFLLPFTFATKKISENQYLRLLTKGSTVNLKDFVTDAGTVEGLLRFNEHFKLKLEPKKIMLVNQLKENKTSSDALPCPKCKKGTVLKGNTAYGCSHYKSGCDFKVSFDLVREKLKDQKATKELVYLILIENS